MSLPATENFAGTNGTTPFNANWTNMAGGGPAILGNGCGDAVGDTAFVFAYWNADAFSAAQYALHRQVPSTPDFNGPSVYNSGTDNLVWFLVINGSSTQILEEISGSLTLRAAISESFTTNDIIKVTANSGTAEAFKNGVSIGTGPILVLSSGSAGCGIRRQGNGYTEFDDWEGGDLGAGGRTTKNTHPTMLGMNLAIRSGMSA